LSEVGSGPGLRIGCLPESDWMSYILDALKKVEREKLKKTAPGGMTSIAGDLFQERIHQTSGGGRWKVVACVVVASLMTFAGTWFMFRDKPEKSITARPAAAPVSIPVAPVPAPVPATPPVAPAPVSPVPPAASPMVPAASPVPPATDDGENEGRPVRTARRQFRQPAQAVAPQQLKPSPNTIQPPADIKLSGIAWQDERSARRAVVNGFLLKEGSVVSGARITEILADRVRFALPNGTFEMRLDAVLPTEVRK